MRRTLAHPDTLAGVKKASFSMPFKNAEIWFEHLDGMYQYTELSLSKLERDSAEFLRPSVTSLIAFVLDETLHSDALSARIAELVTSPSKRFSRAAFVGTDARTRSFLKARLKTAGFPFAFFNDLEQAKQWLVNKL